MEIISFSFNTEFKHESEACVFVCSSSLIILGIFDFKLPLFVNFCIFSTDAENYDKDEDMQSVTNIQDKDYTKTFQHSEGQTHTEDICPKKEDIPKQPDERTLANYENTVISDSDLDSLCKSDDDEGDLFVVDDSDSDLSFF
jgi:hypothetical protein